MQNNVSGNANVAIGSSSLNNNTTGSVNVALGSFNLANNTTGSNNTALGGGFIGASQANNTTGSNNTSVGSLSLAGNSTSSNNTAIGYKALQLVTGANNTALGTSAGTSDTDGFATITSVTNSTAIGYNAQVQQNNSLILGGAGSDAIKVGIGTTAPDNSLTVTGVQYNTGTASQSTNTVTGVGTTWTSAMVGSTLFFANGSKGVITGFTDATHLTVNTSQTVTSQNYRILYQGFQVTASGQLGLNTITPANLFNINTLATADALAQGAISTGSAANKGLVIQGVSGQSGNLQEWQTSTGAILGSVSATGSVLFKTSTDSTTAFDIRSSSNNSILQVDTSGSRVGINLGGGSNQLSSGKQGLDINGALRLSGGGGGNSLIDIFTTPVGSNVETKINIPLYDPGALNQIIALGLPSSANASARAISLFDARTTTHQATLGVFSPDENSVVGFTWNGSNTVAAISTNDTVTGSNNSAGILITSGNPLSGTGLSTGGITIQSGGGTATNTNTGNIVIDSGAKTGSGTAGTISVGVANTSGITIGHTGVTTTINGTLVAGVATFTGTFTVQGHIISGNVSGSTTISVGAGAGTGASASLSGNDTAGVITINTGTGAAAGDLGTITFGTSYGAAPTVVLTPKAVPGGSAYPQYYFDSATGTFTLKSFNALTDSQTYTFSYHIIQ